MSRFDSISSPITGPDDSGDNDVMTAFAANYDQQQQGTSSAVDDPALAVVVLPTPARPQFTSIYNESANGTSAADGEGAEPEFCSRDYFTLLKDNMTQLILIGVCATVYALLLACLYKQHINEIYLFQVSYVVMVTLLALDVCFSFTTSAK